MQIVASCKATKLRAGEFGSDSGSDPEPDRCSGCELESYSDPDTDPDIVDGSDTKGQHLRQRIAFYNGQGSAKSKQSDCLNALVTREFQYWEEWAHPITLIYDANTFKAAFTEGRSLTLPTLSMSVKRRFLTPVLNGASRIWIKKEIL